MGATEERADRTVAVLRQALVPVLSRSSGVAIEILGEPGSGKSRSVATLLAALPCRSLAVDASASLAMPAAKLRAMGSDPGPGTPSSAPAGDASVASFLTAAAAAAPVVIHFDGHDEAVPERRGFLRALAAGVASLRGVGLLSSGTRPLGPPFRSVRQAPLDGGAIRDLLDAEAGSELPTAAVDWIAERVEGHPLFAQEYLRWLTEEGNLSHDGHRWRWLAPGNGRLPPAVAGLLARRLAPLAQEEGPASLMAAIALLPDGQEDGRLALVAGLEATALRRSRSRLLAMGLVREDGLLPHGLYRVAVGDGGLPPAILRRVGLEAVEALAGQPRAAERLADFAWLDPGVRERLHLAAAETARAAGDGAAVARSLASAADLAPPERRAKAALEAARACAGQDYEAMERYAALASELLEEADEALHLLATALAVLGRRQAMQAALERLPAAARQGQAWFDRYCGLLHDCGSIRELLAWWQAHPEHHAGCSARTVHLIASAMLEDGAPRQAQAMLDEAIGRSGWSSADLLELREARGRLRFHQGDYAGAKAAFDELLASPEGLPLQEQANLLRNRAVCTQSLGSYRASLPDLQRAVEMYRQVGNETHRAQTLCMAAFAHFDLAEYGTARAALDQAIGVFRRSSPRSFFHVQALALLTDLHLVGEPRRLPLARACAAEALEVATAMAMPLALLAATIARAAAAPLEEAVAVADEAIAQAEAIGGQPEATINALQVRGEIHERLGDPAAASADLLRAVALAEELGLAYEAQKLSLGLDRLRADSAAARRRLDWFLAREHLHAARLVRRAFPGIEAETQGARPIAGRRPDGLPLLEVLGPARVGSRSAAAAGRGPKRLELLSLLLCARLLGRQELGQTELCDLLYPDRSEAKGFAALKQLVFNLRGSLGQRAVLSTAGGYALGQVASDAELFLAGGDTALWRGPCLVAAAGDLVNEAADRLYLRLAEQAGALLDAAPQEAERLGRILLDRDPYDRTALALTLMALLNQGNTRGLERVYGRQCLQLAELGVAMPQHWQAFLAQPELHRAPER